MYDVRVAAGAVGVLAVRGDRLQLGEDQRASVLAVVAEARAGRAAHHQVGELPLRRRAGRHPQQRRVR